MMETPFKYEIVDVDYWENDAILVIGNQRIYFQWDGTRHPTIEDALSFLIKDLKSKYNEYRQV